MKNNLNTYSGESLEGNFYAIGLNYKKADAEIRGHFSIDNNAKEKILLQAKADGIPSLTVISTCNRTELYGFAQHPYKIIKLLCEHTNGTVEEFEKVAYIYKNHDAVSHLFNVGTGLDSQILGDFEIISQLRNGFREAKKHEIINPFMERLANAVIQASKRIKNETGISSGATSVSFAAVQYIMARVANVSEKNLLLFGTGKIGRNTCENLIKHTKNERITLINRTKNKAEKIAGKFNLVVKDYADIQSEIAQTDVLIVATGAQQPTISKELLHIKKPLLILDLSIPKNVSKDVLENEMVTLVHLDDLSAVTDQTLEQRAAQLPLAKKIIAEVEKEFNQWADNRKFAPTIKALKNKLVEIKAGEIDYQRRKIDGFNEEQAEIISDRIIQKITTHFANHLKGEEGSAESIELIRRVFQLETA
ncbi:glutamyl-tRNA reductase [Aequorivita antarctica]|uniref:Glutamyl-tRNA reductase n=1 Tax=Aequorivita antarctica TaxID=153266 RepID=A0A5C6Z5M1_9FLAO|nr:glutamyl-tRNA reductase [Aequorivita antarctica]TXD74876.1 glutamyl-tRNA reductase [Aequorivita antarctica]SRX72400.1 Glutamyl-tRNA reductase [Aequorivita antarctica]